MATHNNALESCIAEFGKYLTASQGAIFCGAGISRNSGIPLWSELLEEPRKELGLPHGFPDAPLLAQYFVNNARDGKRRLTKMIEASLKQGTGPSELHRLVAALPAAEFWTTNYDTYLEDAMSDADVRSKDDDLASDRPTGSKTVFKMHGSLHAGRLDLRRIVLTRDSYERYENEWPRMWAHLLSTFSSMSILFLGFGFTDPNIEQIFRVARVRFQGRARQHFAVIRAPRRKTSLRVFEYQVQELQRVGVGVVPIRAFDEIEGLLRRLLVVARPPRVFVSGSYPDILWDAACQRLGRALEAAQIEIMSGSSTAGRAVSYAAAAAARERGRYRPEVFTLFWRTVSREPVRLRERLGTVKFLGNNYDELRSALVREARALVVIGGREGTAQEVDLARAGGVPIVPIAATGGVAKNAWKRMIRQRPMFGGRRVSQEQLRGLANPDVDRAVDAAVELLKQAMYLR
ncbi:SIR2 family protein [Candidatus Binatia bacterium]|nr:SIR2 family protein [Candidatus Binatia bacterium]